MIDKITPRALDKSSDHKLVPKTSMIDALNLFISDDNIDEEGNSGVLKNVKGNVNLSYAEPYDKPVNPGVAFKAIGSVTDSITGICYVFMWSEDPRDHGIWAYDKYGKLPHALNLNGAPSSGTPNSIRKVFTSRQFNFPEHGFVKGDIVYKNGSEFRRQDIQRGDLDAEATLAAITQFMEDNGFPPVTVSSYPNGDVIFQDDSLNIYFTGELEDMYPQIIEHFDQPFNSELKLDFSKDALLYFTDNKNEPRKINVYRALMGSFQPFSLDTYDPISTADFICACPKTPLEKITFQFSPDPSISVNNFATTPGFQFAYQNIYKDGMESTISTYSSIAFPQSIINRGAAESSSLLEHNLCTLTIPQQSIEVEKIRLLARYGNTSNFFEIDELPNNHSLGNWDYENREYKFYNDRVGTGVSPQEVDKTFDNVPRKAQAQTTMSNRLIYGNYLEGYNNINVDADLEAVYRPREQDYVNLVLKANTSIEPTPFGDNKCVGFTIDTTDIPNNINEGTSIQAVINYQPENNFHMYQAYDTGSELIGGVGLTADNIGVSYHQSRQRGTYSSNAPGYTHWPLMPQNNQWYDEGEDPATQTGTNNTHADSAAHYQEKGFGSSSDSGENMDSWKSARSEGENYLRFQGEPFFGKNYGVGCGGDESESLGDEGLPVNNPIWRTKNYNTSNPLASGLVNFQDGNAARYGTSAGNPLIIKGGALSFEVKLEITSNITNGKDVVGVTVTEALAGADGAGGGAFTYADLVSVDPSEVVNTARVTKDEYNLGLDYLLNANIDQVAGQGLNALYLYDSSTGEKTVNPNFDFPKAYPGEPLTNLICGFKGENVDANDISNTSMLNSATVDMIPSGYFIINKAEVDFYLELVGDENNHGDERKHLRLGISKIDVAEGDVMSCWKRLDPNSPWWFITPTTIIDPDFSKVFEPSAQWYDDLDNPNSTANNFDYTQYNIISDPENPDYNELEYEQYVNSVAYKFRIANPILFEGYATYAIPHKWFYAKFSTNHNDLYFSGGGINNGFIWVNYGFCGYMDLSNPVRSLYKPHNLFGFEDYVPVVGQSKFKFSLMDGEGGPGAKNAGENSAYNNHDNGGYGSIAARVDIGYNGTSMDGTMATVEDFAGADTIVIYQGLVGGSYPFPDGTNSNIGNLGITPLGVVSNNIANDLDLVADESGSSPVFRIPYVVSGPFFTGSIAMNPCYGDSFLYTNSPGNMSDATYELVDLMGISNAYPFPEIKDYTTTLPLVWVNSGGVSLATGDLIPQNWLNTSYPWPQVIKPEGEFDITDSSGSITNTTLDTTPFANPQEWSGGSTGSGNLQPLNIDFIVDNDLSPDKHSYFGGIDFREYHSHLDLLIQSSIDQPEADGGGSQMSFKSSATHEFGIVYYDQRGRHGYVNHLGSQYIEGYSIISRGDSNSQGAAHVRVNIKHDPPEWAHNYKIVYSRNTSISDFIQYSSGGAFVAEGESPGGDPSRIYMSLNYLQGHTISYSSAWGARSQEGSMVLYTPKDGDRLRVISYMQNPSAGAGEGEVPQRSYPKNYDFEVSGVVSLDDSSENPLAYLQGDGASEGNVVVDENRQGLFLILKNNNLANGFTYNDVRNGAHRWGNNCVVEIYSPTKELDPEDRLYYEIGKTYKVLRLVSSETGAIRYEHEESSILLTEGDVYFRPLAVNFREFDENLFDGDQIGYEDIIINTLDDQDPNDDVNTFRASEANFKSYYLESPAATDLFKSDAISIGRPNVIKHDARESLKLASVIHSDRDIKDSSKVSYSSFNRSIPITQDLDVTGGEVNYLINHNENCFFVQRDKCGYIPIDRSIISDVSGESSLIASSKFFNTPKYYSGRAGADGNPESVVSIDNTAYFAHKSFGEVYRVSGVNGVNVISENNMKSYFRKLFKDAISKSTVKGYDVRVVGGYDPLKNEYLLTVLNPGSLGFRDGLPEVEIPHQLNAQQLLAINNGLEYGCLDFGNLGGFVYADKSCEYIIGCNNELSFPNFEGQPGYDPNVELGGGQYDPTANIHDGTCRLPSEWHWNPCQFNGRVPPHLHDTYGDVPISDLTGWGTQQDFACFNLETGNGNSDPQGNPGVVTFTGETINNYPSWAYKSARRYKDYIDWTTQVTGHTYDEEIHKSLFPRLGKRYWGGNPENGIEYFLIPDDSLVEGDYESIENGWYGWNYQNNQQYTVMNHLNAAAAAQDPTGGGACNDDVLFTCLDGYCNNQYHDGAGNLVGSDKFWFYVDGWYGSGNPVSRSMEDFLTKPPSTYLYPLPFTGNLCDYPLLIDGNGNITAASIVSAFNMVQSMVEVAPAAGGGMIAATHLFPNFAGGTQEIDYDNFYETVAMTEGFPSLNFTNFGGNWFNAMDEWSALATLHAPWYSTNKEGFVTGGPTAPSMNEISVQCIKDPTPTLNFTGNLCDYPILFDENGVITLDSAILAYNDVMGMVSEGEMSLSEATYVYPDINNDGQIQTQDLIDMLILQPNIACEGGLPFTGNPCDYPLLVNKEGMITNESAYAAFISVQNSIAANEFSTQYATHIFPNLIDGNIEAISQADILYLLPMLPLDCGKIGAPEKKPVISRKEKIKKTVQNATSEPIKTPKY